MEKNNEVQMKCTVCKVRPLTDGLMLQVFDDGVFHDALVNNHNTSFKEGVSYNLTGIYNNLGGRSVFMIARVDGVNV